MIITNQNWLNIAWQYSPEISIDGKAMKNSIFFLINFINICFYSGVRKLKVAHKNNGLWIHKAGLNPVLSKFSLCCIIPFIEAR